MDLNLTNKLRSTVVGHSNSLKSKSTVSSHLSKSLHVYKKTKYENECRKSARLTDIIIQTLDGREFPAHKLILISGSQYFESLFNSNMVECRQEKILLKKDIPGDCMELILEYIYTGEIEFDFEIAKTLHENAVFLTMTDLKNIAEKALSVNISLDNCLDLWRHSEIHLGNSLKKNCFEFIERNTIEFFKNYICDLVVEELDTLIKNENLDCSEEFIYENIIKWIKADYENRQIYIKTLMENIDFGKIDNAFKASTILTDEILMENVDFLQIIAKTWKKNLEREIIVKSSKIGKLILVQGKIYELDLDEKKLIEKFKTSGLLPLRVATNFTSNSIFVSYYDNNKPCEVYNLENEKQLCLSHLPKKKPGHRVINLDNKIYICSGSNKSVDEFDIQSGVWKRSPKMVFNKTEFGLCKSKSCIYAVGGSRTIDKYDPREGYWTCIGHTRNFEGFTKSVCIDSTIYAFNKSLVYQFDLRMNNWLEERSIMPEDLYDRSFDCVSINDEIYLCGQTRTSNILAKFDKILGIFNPIPFCFHDKHLEFFDLIYV